MVGQTGHATQRVLVLVASGDPAFEGLVAALLDASGFAPGFAFEWEAAGLSVTRTQPRVVLCDWATPSAHVRALAGEAVARGLPLLLAHSRTELPAPFTNAPAGRRVGWIALPLSADRLRGAVDGLLCGRVVAGDDVAPSDRALRDVARPGEPTQRRPDADDRHPDAIGSTPNAPYNDMRRLRLTRTVLQGGRTMIRRRDSLAETLHEIETGGLEGVAVIVVNRGWWDELELGEQRLLRQRCESLGVALRSDDRLSRHFVELGSLPLESPLSSEREV